MDATASVLERNNSSTVQGVDEAPWTKLDRTEVADQNIGISVSWTCDIEPKEESSEGKTDLTVTAGGSVYKSKLDNVTMPDVPTRVNKTDEVRTFDTLGELKESRSPLDEAFEEMLTPSTATNIARYPKAAGWMKAATCLPPNTGTELGPRDNSWGRVLGINVNKAGMRRT